MSIKNTKAMLLAFLCLFLLKANSQNNAPTGHLLYESWQPTCLTDLLFAKQQQTDPSLRIKQQVINQLILQQQNRAAKTTQVLTIPVVVHVIHNNGPENISNQQIIDGIAHLNQAFANAGPYNETNGVNTNIQFCLAQQDPSGAFTTGINRVVSPLTNLTAETDDPALKNLIVWDTHNYLNIWLVNEISSISLGPSMAGYATYPSSHGQNFDGIVNEARYFGSNVTDSKVHIHEAGHYLGLYHTFEGGCTNNNCQTDGDMVCDTPPDNSTAPVNCSFSANTCNTDADDNSINNPFRSIALGGTGDQPDMFQNYMDYGYQSCQIYFTNGQSTRMNAALSSSRQSLLSSIGCVSACTIPIALSIAADNYTVTAGSYVLFSSSATNATLLDWQISNTSFGNSSFATYQFNTPGTYIVSLTASNSDASCNKTATLSIHVDCTSKASFQVTSAGPYSPGNTVSATNTSQNFNTSQWMVDGQPASTSTNWSQVFNSIGGHSVYLITSDGLCSDSSLTYFFQVGNCNLTGVTNNWVIPSNHFSFNSANPTNLGNFTPMNHPNQECTSTISDRDGNLLFFSDGISCWNKNYQLMPNGTGLLGHFSTTQGVLITPHPGNAKQFYVFSLDAIENNFANGLRYCIVDMSLNGGLGDVIPATKNTLLLAGSLTEKLTATWHANGHDIWVGATENNSNYHAFLIDNAGIHSQSVVSTIGPPSNVALGAMVFSNDGNKMATCVFGSWPWTMLVADFNKATGQFSNAIELPLSSTDNQQIYGLQFSPDNSKLYAGMILGGHLLQYDLSQTTASQIQASQTVVDIYPTSTTFGHMALGKNGKIYVQSGMNGGRIDVINDPNLPGAACNYQGNAISVYNGGAMLCLNNMLQGYSSAFQPSIAGPKDICVGQSVNVYGVLLESSTDVAVWTHTGPGTLVTLPGTNSATLTSASTTGTDTLRVAITGNCGTSYDTLIIRTNNPEIALLSDTTYFCDSVLLQPGTGFLSYEWQNISNYPTFLAKTAGVHWVKMKGASGCVVSDTTRVLHYPANPATNLGNDKIICQGQIAVLQSANTHPNYQWQDGSSNPSYSAYQPGKYWLTTSDNCGNSSADTIHVITTQVNLNLSHNGSDVVCHNQLPFTLNAPAGYISYLWSDGSSAQSLSITATGTYVVKAADAQGCFSSDTLTVINCGLTGIEEHGQSISCFPNPANGHITLTSANYMNSVNVNVYSAIGSLVYTGKWTGFSMVIPTTDIANGVYFIRTDQYMIKLLVQH